MCWSIFYDYFWQLDRHGLGPYIFQLKKLPQLFVCLILAFFFFCVVLKEDSTKKIVFGYFGKRKLNEPMGEKEEKKMKFFCTKKRKCFFF